MAYLSGGQGDRLLIDWTSIRKLGGLVGGDDSGHAFAQWHSDGYDLPAPPITQAPPRGEGA